jgi:hypothetical protein
VVKVFDFLYQQGVHDYSNAGPYAYDGDRGLNIFFDFILSRKRLPSIPEWLSKCNTKRFEEIASLTLVIGNVTQPRLEVAEDIAMLLWQNPGWIPLFEHARLEVIYEQPDRSQHYSSDWLHGDSMMDIPNARDANFQHIRPFINGEYRFYSSPLLGS